MKELLGKIDSKEDKYIGKQYGEKRGRKRVLRGAKALAVARCAQVKKEMGVLIRHTPRSTGVARAQVSTRPLASLWTSVRCTWSSRSAHTTAKQTPTTRDPAAPASRARRSRRTWGSSGKDGQRGCWVFTTPVLGTSTIRRLPAAWLVVREDAPRNSSFLDQVWPDLDIATQAAGWGRLPSSHIGWGRSLKI